LTAARRGQVRDRERVRSGCCRSSLTTTRQTHNSRSRSLCGHQEQVLSATPDVADFAQRLSRLGSNDRSPPGRAQEGYFDAGTAVALAPSTCTMDRPSPVPRKCSNRLQPATCLAIFPCHMPRARPSYQQGTRLFVKRLIISNSRCYSKRPQSNRFIEYLQSLALRIVSKSRRNLAACSDKHRTDQRPGRRSPWRAPRLRD
jgi:hypothetical protein